MNSEELEVSLRTEFESYLKGVLAGIRQDVSDFQKNFEAEFDKQVRVRCEQLGGTFQKNVDGSLTCGARKLARV